MLNIVHDETHYNDERKITAIEVKVKSVAEEGKESLVGNSLWGTVSDAFYKTTLLSDVGTSLRTVPNQNRKDIVDLIVDIKDDTLSRNDVANFVNAFQKALDETSLFL